MKTHTSSFKEQIKLIGKEIDSRITFGGTVLGKDDLNAVTSSYQGAILKSVMKQLDIDSNVEIPIGTILKYEFGLKVNGEYEYINYGNYVVYSIEKQEDTNSYKIVCYDKLLYSMLDYVKLPITYPISIHDYINAISTALGLKFANKSETFANYNKQIQADLYDGLGYTFRDILDELAQVTASTICLNNNDELEIRYITETGDTIDEEFLKDVNVNFGEKFGAVNTIVLSRSGDSDSVYYPPTLPANPYEIKISDNQIMNGNDRADFLPDIYDKLNGLEFYTNDFVSTGICYYDLCDRYSVKVGDNTYSCVMLNDEVLVTQGLEENVYTELPEQTETDYKHASKDDRMINQVYIIAKKNEAEILAVVNTTKEIQKEINPTKDESGSEIIIEDASNNPLIDLEIEGKSTQETRSGKNKFNYEEAKNIDNTQVTEYRIYEISGLKSNTQYNINNLPFTSTLGEKYFYIWSDKTYNSSTRTAMIVPGYYTQKANFMSNANGKVYLAIYPTDATTWETSIQYFKNAQIEEGIDKSEYEKYGATPSPDYPSEIESVGTYNEETGKYEIEVKTVGKNKLNINHYEMRGDGLGFDISALEIGKTYTFSSNKPVTVLKISNYSWNYNSIYYVDRNGFYKYTFVMTRNENIPETEQQYLLLQITKTEDTFVKNISELDGYEMQIEESNVATNYVPFHKPMISLIELNAPLRSLPNGVKDIAYLKNDKLYVDRYVGSVVLDGSENWVISTLNDYQWFRYNLQGIQKNSALLSNYFKDVFGIGNYIGLANNSSLNRIYLAVSSEITTVEQLKTWLSTHNTEVDYELATPVTEELGEIEMLKTLKGYNNISTTDKLLPIINLTYVRDTIIADYVENHVTELKLTGNEIKASVESVSSSVDGLNTTINRVEETTTDNSQVINIISTNIDRTTGEVREVTTTTGFTFNAEGMTIDDGSGFRAQHRAGGTYYKDGESIVGQYTKDGSKQKDLELFGTYSYGKESIEDTPMFVGQLYTDANGEQGFGHFYNGEG